MLDKPEKTRELVATLEAAVPFEVSLMPNLIEHLAAVLLIIEHSLREGQLTGHADMGKRDNDRAVAIRRLNVTADAAHITKVRNS
jgi:hypothetical protein